MKHKAIIIGIIGATVAVAVALAIYAGRADDTTMHITDNGGEVIATVDNIRHTEAVDEYIALAEAIEALGPMPEIDDIGDDTQWAAQDEWWDEFDALFDEQLAVWDTLDDGEQWYILTEYYGDEFDDD